MFKNLFRETVKVNTVIDFFTRELTGCFFTESQKKVNNLLANITLF